jgi:hypothetical protein
MSEVINQIEISYTRLPENCNPVCIRWKNSKGGFDSWVFPREIILTPAAEKPQVFKKGIDYYEDASNIYAKTRGSFKEVVQVSAKGLENQEVKALNYLIHAEKVWEITQDSGYTGGFKYVEIIITGVESQVAEFHPIADFTLTFERPPKPFI